MVDAGFCKLLNETNKSSGIMSVIMNSVITSRKAELDQFALGLGPLLTEAKKAADVFRPLFVHDDSMDHLDSDQVMSLMEIGQLEKKLQEYLEMYIGGKGNYFQVKIKYYTNCSQ